MRKVALAFAGLLATVAPVLVAGAYLFYFPYSEYRRLDTGA